MKACRACGAALAGPFLSLGASPLSNAYLEPAQLAAMEPTYPLDVHWCAQCTLVQIDEVERADHIFNATYAYFSSYSESWLAHSRRYCDEAVARYGLGPGSYVVEVGSNDGYLLQYFVQRGIAARGVEPSRSVATVAIEKGIPTDVTFFDPAYAAAMERRADLLIGNNVLAHNPDLRGFSSAIAAALAPAGVATLEFPHLVRLLEHDQFDTIYHEHFSYLSLHAVDALFRRHGLVVFDVEELATHGGSLRIHAQRERGGRAVTPRVAEILELERARGLLVADTYAAFGARVAEAKRALLTFLIEAKRRDKRVVGYGAPAKGNTLLNYCGVRTDFLDYTVDRSPHKQGRFLPGSRIPIFAPARIFEDKPDYVLILAWNLRDELIAQLAGIEAWGGRCVIPIPTVEIVG